MKKAVVFYSLSGNTQAAAKEIAEGIVAVFTFSGGGDNKRCIAKLSKRLPRLKVEVALANRDSDLAIHNADKIHHFIKEVERLV